MKFVTGSVRILQKTFVSSRIKFQVSIFKKILDVYSETLLKNIFSRKIILKKIWGLDFG